MRQTGFKDTGDWTQVETIRDRADNHRKFRETEVFKIKPPDTETPDPDTLDRNIIFYFEPKPSSFALLTFICKPIRLK